MTYLSNTHIYRSPESPDQLSNLKPSRFVPRKSLLNIFMVVILLVGLVSTAILIKMNQDRRSRAQPGNKVKLLISPETISVNRGQTFTFYVFADNPSLRITAATIRISFDPQYLELVSLKETEYLPTKLASSIKAKEATISVGITHDSPRKISGNIALATFRMIRSTGETVIKLDRSKVAATESDENVADITGNLTVAAREMRTPPPYSSVSCKVKVYPATADTTLPYSYTNDIDTTSHLISPGEYYVYTVEVENKGSQTVREEAVATISHENGAREPISIVNTSKSCTIESVDKTIRCTTNYNIDAGATQILSSAFLAKILAPPEGITQTSTTFSIRGETVRPDCTVILSFKKGTTPTSTPTSTPIPTPTPVPTFSPPPIPTLSPTPKS